jgi:hypothetical protein
VKSVRHKASVAGPLKRRLAALRAFLKAFEARWHLESGTGRLRPDRWWEKITRRTLTRSLEARLTEELKHVKMIEREVKKLATVKAKQARLLEYARVDVLSPNERRLYLRNKVEGPRWGPPLLHRKIQAVN